MPATKVSRSGRRIGYELEFCRITPKKLVDVINSVRGHKALDIEDAYSYTPYKTWEVKEDCSCGMEVTTPILNGRRDLRNSIKVVKKLQRHCHVNRNCGFHVHVEAKDFQLLIKRRILTAWWIKMENVIMQCFPKRRRNSRYAFQVRRSISRAWDERVDGPTLVLYKHLKNPGPHRVREMNDFISVISQMLEEHYSCISFEPLFDRRKTIEFRTCEGTIDPETVWMWSNIVMRIMDSCKDACMPTDLQDLSIDETLRFLRLTSNFGINGKMRRWILRRMRQNCQEDMKSEIRKFIRRKSRRIR